MRKSKAKEKNVVFLFLTVKQNNNNLSIKRRPRMLKRILSMTLTAVFILPVAAQVMAQEDESAKINQYVDQFSEIIPKDFELMAKIQLIKDADLTYQKSLTVPVADLLDCKSKEELHLLLGIYIFDTNYAMLFDRRKEVQEAWELGFQKTMEKLALYGEVGVAMLPAADLKEMLENPTDQNMRSIFVRDILKQIEAILKRARKGPEFLSVVVDEFYGAIIEGLYVVCKLAQNEDLDKKKVVALFNGLQESLGGFDKMEAIFAGDKRFEDMFRKAERDEVLNPIHTLLTTKEGKLKVEDLKEILSIIEPIRNRVVRKCN